LATAVVSVLTLVGISVALIATDPGLALYVFALLPVLVLATVVFRRRASAAYTEARERVSAVNADMQENVSGLRVAQAYTREERSAADFASRSDAYRRSRLRAQRYVATYFPFVTLLSGVAEVLVLAAGASRVAEGTLSPGVLMAFVLYLGLFFSPVQQLSSVFDGYQQSKVGLRRIGDLLRTPTSVPAGQPGGRPRAAERGRPAHRRRVPLPRYRDTRARRPLARRARRDHGGVRRCDGCGQVDRRQAPGPVLRRHLRHGVHRRRRRTRLRPGRVARPRRGGAAGTAPVRGHGRRQRPLRTAGRHRRRGGAGRPRGRRTRRHRRPSGGLRPAGRRTRTRVVG